MKNVKGGTLWDLLTYIQLQNIKKLERGTLWRQQKSKNSTVPKKTKGGPLSPVRFCRLRLKSKKSMGGALWNNLDAFPGYSFSFL